MAVKEDRGWEDFYGPLIFDKTHPLSMGADVGTNNTGELMGIGMALLGVLGNGKKGNKIRINYDSKYAANVTVGKWCPKNNLDLAKKCQEHARPFSAR